MSSARSPAPTRSSPNFANSRYQSSHSAVNGAPGPTRTGTLSPAPDFESGASTDSATGAMGVAARGHHSGSGCRVNAPDNAPDTGLDRPARARRALNSSRQFICWPTVAAFMLWLIFMLDYMRFLLRMPDCGSRRCPHHALAPCADARLVCSARPLSASVRQAGSVGRLPRPRGRP
jgi:hypothetical protein